MRWPLPTALCALALAAPATAAGATFGAGASPGDLVLFDDASENNEMSVNRSIFPGSDNDELEFAEFENGIVIEGDTPPGCFSGGGDLGREFSFQVFCEGYETSESITVSGGAGTDQIASSASTGSVPPPSTLRAGFTTVPFVLLGGTGFDTIQGGAGIDLIDTGPDPGETVSGGESSDVADYSRRATPIAASLDGVANDGAAGENDQILSDIEGILGGPGDDRLAGGNYPASLNGGPGNDVLLGGSGSDSLAGGPGNDYVAANDGRAETVSCGPGGDYVQADSGDGVSSDCETVARPSLAPTELPPPTLGRTFVIERASGIVFVTIGITRFRLTEGALVPTGARIDTRLGKVTITAERKGPGDTDVFTFSRGIFVLKQSRVTGITETRLRGGSFRNCSTASRATAGEPLADTARRRKRRVRRLFGKGKGRFRTRGAFGAATVRGTRYRVTDRCDGTAFRVTEGGIRIRSFVLDKTLVLTVRRINGRRGRRTFLAPATPPGS